MTNERYLGVFRQADGINAARLKHIRRVGREAEFQLAIVVYGLNRRRSRIAEENRVQRRVKRDGFQRAFAEREGVNQRIQVIAFLV